MPRGVSHAASVCFLLTSLDVGGAETQVINLASRFKERGWTVRLVSMLAPEAWFDTLESMQIEFVSLHMPRGIPDVRGLIRLVALLRKWRPHVLHCHMVHANILGRIARLASPVPVVISTAHNIDEGGHWRELAYRFTDGLADITTNVSQAAVDCYVRVGAAPENKIRFIPNGLDTDRFKPDGQYVKALREELGLDDSFVWLAVGRLEKEKDYPCMLRAFAMVQAAGRSMLLIAGRGPDEGALKSLARDLGIADRVRFIGVRTDVERLMNAADAYVMSSAWEGLPMVLLEAAATALPAVTTDVGGCREIVIDGETGAVVQPENPRELAEAMLRIMTMPEAQRLALGRAGRRHVEKYFRLDRVVDVWEALYEEFLSRKGVVAKPIPVDLNTAA